MLKFNKPEGAEGAEGAGGAVGGEVAKWADVTNVALIYRYIVMLLEHHGNRLWGF